MRYANQMNPYRYSAEQCNRKKKQYPGTWAVANSCRYELGHKAVEYMNQENSAEDVFVRLLAYGNDFNLWVKSGTYEEGLGKGQALQVALWLVLIHYEQRTIYLERDIGEMLIRTHPLENIHLTDLHFPWPYFRLNLPFGLIDSPKMGSVVSIILGTLQEGFFQVPDIIAQELNIVNGFTIHEKKEGTTDVVAMMIVTATERNDQNTGLVYSMMPINKNLGQILAMPAIPDPTIRQEDLSALKIPPAEYDEDGLRQARRLALNLLVCLSTLPAETNWRQDVVRPAKLIGRDHIRPAIHRPLWAGQRIFKQFGPPEHHEHLDPTGKHLPAHWRCGHFKRQPSGKGLLERKIIWIKPYKTTGEGYLENSSE